MGIVAGDEKVTIILPPVTGKAQYPKPVEDTNEFPGETGDKLRRGVCSAK